MKNEFYHRVSTLWDTPSKKIILFGLVIHLVTCIFSEGFYHPDEHFQIIEMAYRKFELLSSNLSWEFKLGMRSWVQPLFVFWGLVKPLELLGINSFAIAFLIRLVHSIFGIYTYSLWTKVQDDIKNKNLLFILGLLVWYLPFIHARTSSENISMALFFFSLYWFKKESPMVSGFISALTFFTRFQMAIFIAFFHLHDVVYHKIELKKYWRLIIGFSLGMVLCVALDSYAQGEFVFTPWNYFSQNLIHDKVSLFGVKPFWYYIPTLAIKGIPPLSLLFIFLAFYFFYKNRSHYITWICIPFFIVHSFIGHKEIRFLIPVYMLIPYMLCYLYERNHSFLQKKWIVKPAIVINIGLLFYMSFTPANGIISLYRATNKIPERALYTIDSDNNFKLEMDFYNKNKIKVNPVNMTMLDAVLSRPKSYWLVSKKNEFDIFLNQKNCQIVYSRRIKFLMKYGKANYTSIWECQAKSKV